MRPCSDLLLGFHGLTSGEAAEWIASYPHPGPYKASWRKANSISKEEKASWAAKLRGGGDREL